MCSTYIYWITPVLHIGQGAGNDVGMGPVPAELRLFLLWVPFSTCLKIMPSNSNF